TVVQKLGLVPGDELRVDTDDKKHRPASIGQPGRGPAAHARASGGKPGRRVRAGVPRPAARRVALIVLDASVLIALLDPNDALHTAARAALARHAGDDLKLPASAYA